MSIWFSNCAVVINNVNNFSRENNQNTVVVISGRAFSKKKQKMPTIRQNNGRPSICNAFAIATLSSYSFCTILYTYITGQHRRTHYHHHLHCISHYINMNKVHWRHKNQNQQRTTDDDMQSKTFSLLANIRRITEYITHITWHNNTCSIFFLCVFGCLPNTLIIIHIIIVCFCHLLHGKLQPDLKLLSGVRGE